MNRAVALDGEGGGMSTWQLPMVQAEALSIGCGPKPLLMVGLISLDSDCT